MTLLVPPRPSPGLSQRRGPRRAASDEAAEPPRAEQASEDIADLRHPSSPGGAAERGTEAAGHGEGAQGAATADYGGVTTQSLPIALAQLQTALPAPDYSSAGDAATLPAVGAFTPVAVGGGLIAGSALIARSMRQSDPPKTAALTVIDGYLKGAQIFIDRDRDGIPDEEEKLAGVLTGDRGDVVLPASLLTAPVIAVGGINIDTGKPNRMILTAPAEATVLTPLTTLQQALILGGRVADARDAQTRLIAALGIDSASPGLQLETYDPVQKENLALQRAGVTMATLIDLGSADDDAGERKILANLALAIENAYLAKTPVALESIPLLEMILSGVVASESTKSNISTALRSVANASSLEDLSSLQKRVLSDLAPVAPALKIDPVSTEDPVLVTADLSAIGNEGERAIRAGDSLKMMLYNRSEVITSVSVPLSSRDISLGSIAVQLPEEAVASGLSVVAQITTPTGLVSQIDAEQVALDNGAAPPPTNSGKDSSTQSPDTGSPAKYGKTADLTFSYRDALTSALFADQAYEPEDGLVPWLQSLGWTPIDPGNPKASYLRADNAVAIAARHDAINAPVTQFIISFKGTDSLADWGSNLLRFGWTSYYEALMPLMAKVIDAALSAEQGGREVELLITGHSLGGAAATLAFADLVVNPNEDFWRVDGTWLSKPDRIYADPLLNAKWTATQIASLIDNAHVYTFGAPSFLIDPNKLDLSPASLLKLPELELFFSLDQILKDVLTVRETQIPKLDGYAARAFQFEHVNSDPWSSDDIVAQLGDRDPGTVLTIDLDSQVYNRYGTEFLFGFGSVTTPIDVHVMGSYIESLARAISGSKLLKSSASLADASPLLPKPSAATQFNDMLYGASIDGLAGNDILMADAAQTFRFNGGPGDDVYLVSRFGAHVVIDAPIVGLDSVYFALPGSISSNDRIDPATRRVDRVVSITNQGETASVTVAGWDTDPQGGANALDFVGQILPSDKDLWTVLPAPAPVL